MRVPDTRSEISRDYQITTEVIPEGVRRLNTINKTTRDYEETTITFHETTIENTKEYHETTKY